MRKDGSPPHSKAAYESPNQLPQLGLAQCILYASPLSFVSLLTPVVTFAAATILAAAHLCPAIEVQSDEASFETSWDRCMAILEKYQTQLRAASRAISVLESLRSLISSRKWVRLIAAQGHADSCSRNGN